MTFHEFSLHDDLLAGVDAMNYQQATPVQEQAIPKILDGKDLIACAQTGTGKTAAYLLPLLDKITADEPQNADAWNLRGFANRKLGNMDVAATSYTAALKINPGHLGALEYQGEMYLELGQTDAAKENLKKLQGLCGDCEEATDLAESIGAKG